MPVRTYRPESQAIRSEPSQYLKAYIDVVCPVDKTPIGTCSRSSVTTIMCDANCDSHATSSFRERCNDEFPVLLSPSPHCPVFANKRLYMTLDIFPLASFLVKGYMIGRGCQGIKNGLYVLLRATCDADYLDIHPVGRL